MSEAINCLNQLTKNTGARALVKELEGKIDWKAAHSRRVAQLAARFLETRGMRPDVAAQAALGPYVHDVGTILDPTIIKLVQAPRILSADERLVVGRHAELGAELVAHRLYAGSRRRDKEIVERAALVTRHHHDTPGPTLALVSSLTHVASTINLTEIIDVFDARTDQNRPYLRTGSGAMSFEEAGEMLPIQYLGVTAFGVPASEVCEQLMVLAQEPLRVA